MPNEINRSFLFRGCFTCSIYYFNLQLHCNWKNSTKMYRQSSKRYYRKKNWKGATHYLLVRSLSVLANNFPCCCDLQLKILCQNLQQQQRKGVEVIATERGYPISWKLFYHSVRVPFECFFYINPFSFLLAALTLLLPFLSFLLLFFLHLLLLSLSSFCLCFAFTTSPPFLPVFLTYHLHILV